MEKREINYDAITQRLAHIASITLMILGCASIFLFIIKPYIIIPIVIVMLFLSITAYLLFTSVRTLITELFHDMSRDID